MRDTSHVGTAIRFASGAAAGSLIGFWIATSIGTKDVVVFGATVIVAAAMASVLAARFGRRFWEAFSRLRWFVP